VDPPDPAQERELEALLALSKRGRAKMERLHEILTSPGHHGTGASPASVVYRENKLRLLRLLDESGEPRRGPPVLFVPAPVSRYFIIDLLPGRSFAGHVAAAGFDVYIADFGTPTREDRFADLEYYIDGLVRRCVRTISTLTGNSSINVIGYCLGGTLSLLYAALHPETVRRLVLLTTTVDGDVEGGIAWVAHRMGLEGESYDDPRLVPAVEVKRWFEMLAPGSNSLMGRVTDLWNRLDDPPERLRDVRTMATWVDDVVPAPGRLLAELYRKFGPGRNALMAGTATLGDRPLDLSSVSMPVLAVSAEKDTIAPPAGVDAIKRIVPQTEVLRLSGGHVGIVAGRTAATLWKRTVEFLMANGTGDAHA
jgi:poly[(R)-3-hydroxyalkanoate] polymerase subunit PhaC